LVYEDERMSFTEAMQQVDALSCLLVNTYGIKKGDRVAVAMRNYPEWVMSFAAIISIGAVSVSMNSWWTADEMEFALEDSGSKVLICDDQRLALAYSFCQKQNIAMLLVRAEGNIPAGVGQWEKDLPLGSAHPGADISPDDDATILYTSGTTGRLREQFLLTAPSFQRSWASPCVLRSTTFVKEQNPIRMPCQQALFSSCRSSMSLVVSQS
jgi:long-chain acyl-CoA synthetase